MGIRCEYMSGKRRVAAGHTLICDSALTRGQAVARIWSCECGVVFGRMYDAEALKVMRKHS